LEAANEARRAAARRLREALAEIDSLHAPATVAEGEDHVYHQFVIRTAERDALRKQLTALGIATGIHYPIPIHRSQAYAAECRGVDVAPNCSRLADEVLSLPIFPAITDAQIERIAVTLERCVIPSRDPLPTLSS
jgi:dTDP-4-amino-4,6-dideoxygalactose transaminase